MRALWLVEDCVICRYNHLGGDYGRGIKFQTRCYAFRHKSHLGRERKRQLTTTHEAKRPARNWVEYIAPLCFRSDLAVVVSAIFVLEYHLECHFVSCHQILVLLVLLHNFTKYILEIVMTVVLSLFLLNLSPHLWQYISFEHYLHYYNAFWTDIWRNLIETMRPNVRWSCLRWLLV